jgi:hypothetical protein
MTRSGSCEWCGQLTAPDKALCDNCSWAKEQADQDQLTFQQEARTKKTPAQQAWHITLQIGKGLVAAFLSLIAIVAALAGTCSVLATIFSGSSALSYAAIGFSVLVLMIWLIYMMYRNDIMAGRSRRLARAVPPGRQPLANAKVLPAPTTSEEQPPSVQATTDSDATGKTSDSGLPPDTDDKTSGTAAADGLDKPEDQK